VAHDIQKSGLAVQGGIEREGPVLVVGKKADVVDEVARNVGAIQGDEAFGPDRRMEKLDVERASGSRYSSPLRPDRNALDQGEKES
jgi:hypothetical protein